MQARIKVFEIVEEAKASTLNQAIELFQAVSKKLSKNMIVSLDFEEITGLDSKFLDEFVQRLYLRYTSNFLKEKLIVVKIRKKLSLQLKNAVEEAKRFSDLKREAHCKTLYPFLGKKVYTPEGIGVLWQVFSSRVGVLLPGYKTVSFFYDPFDVTLLETKNAVKA